MLFSSALELPISLLQSTSTSSSSLELSALTAVKTNPKARFFFFFRFTFFYHAHFLEVTFVHKMYFSSHPPPFLFDAKSRTTRITAREFAQLSTVLKMGTYDWLSVNPRGNTRSRRISKNNLRGIMLGIGPIRGITSLTSS